MDFLLPDGFCQAIINTFDLDMTTWIADNNAFAVDGPEATF